MKLVARSFGVALALFALLGLVVANFAKSWGAGLPKIPDVAWTGEARAMADYVIYLLLLLGAILLVRLRNAVVPLALGLMVALGRLAFDLRYGDSETARGETILKGDYVAIGVLLLGVACALLWNARRAEPAHEPFIP